MAASVNPFGNNNNQEGSTSNGNSANGISVPENSVVGPTQTALTLRHNSGLRVEWTPDEQSVLEDFACQIIEEIKSTNILNPLCKTIYFHHPGPYAIVKSRRSLFKLN